MDWKGCGRKRSRSVPMYYSVICLYGWRETTKPLSGWSVSPPWFSGRLDFVTWSCRPWLPYTTNVKSISSVVFYQPVCFYLPFCLCSLAGCLFLQQCFISSLYRNDNSSIWHRHSYDFFLILQFFIRLRISMKLIEVRKTHLLFIWINIRSEAMK